METALLVAIVSTLGISWVALVAHCIRMQLELVKEIENSYTRGYRNGREYERGLNK